MATSRQPSPQPPQEQGAAGTEALPRPQRLALLGLGYGCLGLAALGAMLPLLPTTVFLIIAAWAFGRASPRLRARLLNDPRIGPTLRDWQEHGTVSPAAKRAASLAMAASWTLATLLSRSLLVSALSGACLLGVAAWLLTRPSTAPSTIPSGVPPAGGAA